MPELGARESSSPRGLGQISALTFDCYGTLIDWEAGILAVLKPWSSRASITASDDALLAHFADAEHAAEAAAPTAAYRDILRDVMKRIGHATGAAVTGADERMLAESVGDWPAFGDTVEALVRLKRGRSLIIVSNVDRVSFERTAARLGVVFDAVVTAEGVGAYKPDRRMFDAALGVVDSLRVERDQHMHVAQSLFHDIEPAQALGIRTCWVDRRGGRAGGATRAPMGDATPEVTVRSLTELAELIDG